MTEDDIDLRLKALLAEAPSAPDTAFANKIIALAAYDAALHRARRRTTFRIVGECAALAVILVAFAALARSPGPALAGLGDTIPMASPAILGIAMLALWCVASLRSEASPAS